MDEAKKKELEELRKQIDPEVLKRVADAMGGGDTAAAAGATGGGGDETSAPAPPARTGGGGSLADLKARIARRERELDQEEKKVPEKTNLLFIVYSPTHFRAKQLGGYLNRMMFSNVQLCSKPQDFVKAMLVAGNDPNIERVAIAVHLEIYPGLQTLLGAAEMRAVFAKLPKLADAPKFAIMEKSDENEIPEGLDTSFVVSMKTSTDFNRKRILKTLGME